MAEETRNELLLTPASWSGEVSTRLGANLAALAATRADFLRGERLGARGRYEVLAWVGSGATGSVYRARDCELGRHVALKVVDRRAATLPSDALALARFRHENIVTLYDHGEVDGRSMLVLEWVSGETLQRRIERGKAGAADSVAIVSQVVRGLAHAHQSGVLHRDLKPANVLISEQGQVKVADFGLAAIAGEPGRLAGDGPAGTPAYMAPEQWRGEADERSDLFACGEILYELLTGERPFPAGAAAGAAPVERELPAGFARLLEKAMAREPEARFQTAGELLVALDALSGERVPGQAASQLPYRYLEAFAEEDAAFFFGRDAETTALQLVLSRWPLVAVVGPSGAGKTSLVQAGLVRRLQMDRVPLKVLAVRPGGAPLATLCGRIAEAQTSGATLDVATLRAAPGRAGRALRDAAAAGGWRVLLLVDQLEELYTHGVGADERAAFIAALLAAGDDPEGPVRVVITVREDYLHRFAESAELFEHRVFVRPPDRAALLEALCGPARALSFELEPGMEEEIVAALAGEPTPLPLLELCASRLWEKRDQDRRLLSWATLRELGGVAGVMAAHAEEVLAELGSPAAVDITRQIFCELSTAERTKQRRDRDQLLGAFPDQAAAARVLDHLLRRRLLVARQTDEGSSVEVPSEALLARWDRLAAWLDEGLAARLLRERLEQAAGAWEDAGRAHELLWTGRMLAEAAELPRPRGASAAFLAASLAKRRRRTRWRWVATVASALLLAGIAAGSVVAMRVYAAQRDHARRFAHLLLFDLRDGIAPLPGSTPVMNQLVSAALDYYRENTDAEQGDAEQRHDLAVAYRRIGEVALQLGRTADARDVEGRAGRIFGQLARERPGAAAPALELAGSFGQQAVIAIEQGRTADAEDGYTRALAIRKRVAAEWPDDPQASMELAVGERVVGDFLAGQGRMREARDHLARAAAQSEALAGRDPGRADWQLQLATAYQKLGSVALSDHKFDDAFAFYDRARGLRQRLVARDGNNTYWLRELGRSYAMLAEVRWQEHRLEESRRFALEFLGINIRLAASDPSSVDRQYGVSLAHARLCLAATGQGRLPEARFHCELEQAIVGRVAAADPNSRRYQRDLARSLTRLFDVALAQGDLDAAEAHQAAALAIWERLATQDPGDLGDGRELDDSLEGASKLAERRGRIQQARAIGLRLLGSRMLLELRHPDIPDLEGERLRAHVRLANIAMTQGQLEDARGQLALATAVASHLRAVRPEDPSASEAMADLAKAEARLAQGSLGRPREHREP